MQQYFRVVRGQSSALDDGVNSSAVPVFPSVSSEMSDSAPSGESADGRSAAASLSSARQLASLTENAVAQSNVISETAAVQSSLATDVVAMNATLSQLVGVVMQQSRDPAWQPGYAGRLARYHRHCHRQHRQYCCCHLPKLS